MGHELAVGGKAADCQLMWVRVWVRQLTRILTHTIFSVFAAKKHRKPKFSMLFGAGGVTRTHDLLITNYDSFVSPISVNTRKVLCRKASGVFVFRGISPIWAGFG